MEENTYVLLGVIGPLFAYVSIGVSIALSPWFSWEQNALSDLGHAVKSGVAPLYNFGLLLTGALIALYAAKALKEYAEWTSYSVAFSAFTLQLVSVFDEVYGVLHFAVSLLFFISLAFTCTIYAVERKSRVAVAALVIGITSWVLYGANIYAVGIAVPETTSSLAVTFLIIWSAIEIFRSR